MQTYTYIMKLDEVKLQQVLGNDKIKKEKIFNKVSLA